MRWAFRNNADEMWQASAHEPEICYEKRHVLACPFCEGDPAPLDENDHTSCTNITCGSTAYMHVDAWNNRPAMKAYARIEELEAEFGGWLTIDSAPKDGTKVDLWVRIRPSKMEEPESYERFPASWWDADRNDWKLGRLCWHSKFYADAHVPTHWMPVPSHPFSTVRNV